MIEEIRVGYLRGIDPPITWIKPVNCIALGGQLSCGVLVLVDAVKIPDRLTRGHEWHVDRLPSFPLAALWLDDETRQIGCCCLAQNHANTLAGKQNELEMMEADEWRGEEGHSGGGGRNEP